jgi:hypothetical protein
MEILCSSVSTRLQKINFKKLKSLQTSSASFMTSEFPQAANL